MDTNASPCPSPSRLPLLDLLRSMPGVASVAFHVEPIDRRSSGIADAWSREALHFRCTLTIDRPLHHGGGRTSPWTSTIVTEWSCGTGHADAWWSQNVLEACKLARNRNGGGFIDVPFAYVLAKDPEARRSIDGTAAVGHLRSGYRPTLDDVLGSILGDIESVEASESWEDWSQEMGMLEGISKSPSPAKALLDIQSAWHTTKANKRALVAMVGSQGLGTLIEAARGL